MKIAAYTAGDDASAALRIQWPAEALATQGHDITINPPLRTGWTEQFDGLQPPHWVQCLAAETDADIVVLQRPLHVQYLTVIPALQATGVRVVIDIDDHFDAIDPGNQAWMMAEPHWLHPAELAEIEARFGPVKVTKRAKDGWAYCPEFAGRSNRDNLRAAVALADAVTVSTPALAAHYGQFNQRVTVVPNRIPRRYLTIGRMKRETRGTVTVGWTGNTSTHPRDLQVMDGALRRSAGRTRFMVVGTGLGVERATGRRPDAATGWVSLDEYPRAYAQLDVAVCPLRVDTFNQSKCLDKATRVSTPRGIIPIGELVVGDRVWSPVGWVAVQATSHEPTTVGLKITTSQGRELRLTSNHRMMVNGEWTMASDIQQGDIIALSPDVVAQESPQFARWPSDGRIGRRPGNDPYSFVTAEDAPAVTISERWGRFLGLFAGDGSVGASATACAIHCDGIDPDLIDMVQDDIRAFGLHPSTQTNTMFDGTPTRRRSVHAASTHMLRFMRTLGLVSEANKRIVCIPEIIWRSPKPVVAQFLAGLFEADGCNANAGVQLSSIHHGFILDVQRLLVGFGIESTVKEVWNTARTGGKRHRSFRLTIRRAGADVFVKEIGFLSKRKSERLAVTTTRPHSNAFRLMTWTDTVASMEPCELDPVDIQVEGEVFAAGGFLSHNSRLKPLEAAALGVIPIMSPTDEYLALAAEGVGLVASRPKEWAAHLDTLIGSPMLRATMRARGLEVAAEHTIEGHAESFRAGWMAGAEVTA